MSTQGSNGSGVAVHESIVKAYVVGEDIQTSNVVPAIEDSSQAFSSVGALEPPYDPRSLCRMFEESAALRPNVDAYATNIEAFGHRLEPVVDLEADDADAKIQDAIILAKVHDDKLPTFTEEEVKSLRLMLPQAMRVEKLRLEIFFKHCAGDLSFIELRERTRQDLEVTGNAYWEVARNKAGEVAQLTHVPSLTVRMMRVDARTTDVEMPQKISAFELRRVKVRRRLRRFVQIVNGLEAVYFKELDDPRVLSSRSGKFFPTLQALKAAEPHSAPATEMLHFKINSTITPYGVPRWIGATPAVLGSRASEEVNLAYFDNKAVPPLAILVSGGKLAQGMAERIKDHIRNNIKGRNNFHAVLVLEAEPASAGPMSGAQTSRCRIEIKPLMEAQQQDALFQTYDANNTEKVGNQFRLPKLLRGNTADFNRATADAALQYAEQQIFQPERNKIDHVINRRILPHRGVRFFEFVSNSPVEKDPPVVAEMVAKLSEACVITPQEGRAVLANVFGREIKNIDAPWVRIPPKFMLAGIQPPPTPEEIEAAEKAGKDKEEKPNIALAPTDAIAILTVNEARSALGLGPFKVNGVPAPEGDMSVSEFITSRAPQPGGFGAPGGGGFGKGTPEALTGAPAPPLLAPAAPTIEEEALRLINLRNALAHAEEAVSSAALTEARRQDATQTIAVPASEWSKWFEPEQKGAALSPDAPPELVGIIRPEDLAKALPEDEDEDEDEDEEDDET